MKNDYTIVDVNYIKIRLVCHLKSHGLRQALFLASWFMSPYMFFFSGTLKKDDHFFLPSSSYPVTNDDKLVG